VNSRLTVAAGMATVLASIALYTLLRTGGWFWDGIGAVIVVGGIGAATRLRPLPASACFLAALAGEFLYLNALFAHQQSWAAVVPTRASVRHLSSLIGQAAAEVPHSTPPVQGHPAIVLAVVAGIGLVGALTDLLAVRLHRPAIAGLPLLVLFCVPLTTNAKPGAVGGALVFCAGVTGYLALLSAEGRYRLGLWGRVVHPWRDTESVAPDTRLLAAAGRRIGSAAVVLALFLPLLVPAARAHRLFAGLGGGGGTGSGGGQAAGGPVSFPNPLDLLNTDLQDRHPQVVLSYQATGLGTPPYLQLYVLGDLTTSAWTMAPPTGTRTLASGGVMPPAPGLTAATPGLGVREAITLASGLNDGDGNYLPVPYPDSQLSVRGTWQVDPGSLTVHSTSAQLAGLHYTVSSEELIPSPRRLSHAGAPPAALTAYTTVPSAFDGLKTLADQLTAGQTSAYGKAVLLQAWFHRPGNFRYSLTTHLGNGAAALVRFLTTSRAGSCQQFAFGMAVLARLLGIPSRVVIGFTQGTFAGGDTWQVRTSDAHAWPELYFRGAGWLGFEPTPPNANGPAGQGTATAPPYSEPQGLPGGTTSSRAAQKPGSHASASAANPSSHGFSHKPTVPVADKSGATVATQRGAPAPIWPIAAGLLVVLLLTPGATRVIARRWRWRGAHDDVTTAHLSWRELCDDLSDHRIAWQPSESPRALTRRIAGMLDLTEAERAALERVARAEERASYAASPADSAGLHADVRLVRGAITRASGRPARWQARMAPPSVLAPARAGLRHALDVFGWMELATTRARGNSAARRRAPHPHIS
jgi:transglutaminase-like putative cysteine protease